MVKRARLSKSGISKSYATESRLDRFARQHPKLFYSLEPVALGAGIYGFPAAIRGDPSGLIMVAPSVAQGMYIAASSLRRGSKNRVKK